MTKPHVLIITPAVAKANNGNWQTAARWSRFLREHYRVSCVSWVAGMSDALRPDAVIALHARRSAEGLLEFERTQPATPLILLLTGTDLYRDIHTDWQARHSLQLATRLVVLQSAGLTELAPALLQKTEVIYQSARSLKPPDRQQGERRFFDIIMIGHLRAEKDPATFLHAIASVSDPRIRFTHIGRALESGLAQQATVAAASNPRYHWLGDQTRGVTRQRLKCSDVMVITSIMEGGANVIIEAVTSGVAVLASDISGNRGMLGDDYAGYFPVGDVAALAALMQRVARDREFLALLRMQCGARAPLFAPQRERAAVCQLVDNCLQISTSLRAIAPLTSLCKDL